MALAIQAHHSFTARPRCTKRSGTPRSKAILRSRCIGLLERLLLPPYLATRPATTSRTELTRLRRVGLNATGYALVPAVAGIAAGYVRVKATLSAASGTPLTVLSVGRNTSQQ
jgi:hypothetical protein